MDTLATALYILIAFSLSLYFWLDGYTLGVGLNMPLIGDGQAREDAIRSVTPFWDANQTWLVFAVSALYGAFPTLYSTILPTFYIEIVVLLMLLFVRGIVFEFYEKFTRPGLFQILLFLTALTAAYLQGAIVTQLVIGAGITNEPGRGEIWQYASALGGFSFIMIYTVLGSAWLRMYRQRSNGIQVSNHRHVPGIMAVILMAFWIATCLTEQPLIAARFGSRIGIMLCLVFIGAMLAVLITLFGGRYAKPFLLTACPVMLVAAIACACLYPDLVIGTLQPQDAAASHASLAFLLSGLAIMLPLILAYTFYSYRSLLKT